MCIAISDTPSDTQLMCDTRYRDRSTEGRSSISPNLSGGRRCSFCDFRCWGSSLQGDVIPGSCHSRGSTLRESVIAESRRCRTWLQGVLRSRCYPWYHVTDERVEKLLETFSTTVNRIWVTKAPRFGMHCTSQADG